MIMVRTQSLTIAIMMRCQQYAAGKSKQAMQTKPYATQFP